jgi:hydroxyacylglutathione hydrolase
VFGSWLGWLVPADRPLVFILDEGQDRGELVRQCLDIGHEQLVGELAGGIDGWAASGRPLSTIPLVNPDAVTGQVVDVRQANEFATGHLPGAVSVELGQLATAALPSGRVTVMCGHGERAMSGASLLTAQGRAGVAVLDGGPDTWSSVTGRPLVSGR